MADYPNNLDDDEDDDTDSDDENDGKNFVFSLQLIDKLKKLQNLISFMQTLLSKIGIFIHFS